MLLPEWMRCEPLPKEEFDALIAEIEAEIVAEMEDAEELRRAV